MKLHIDVKLCNVKGTSIKTIPCLPFSLPVMFPLPNLFAKLSVNNVFGKVTDKKCKLNSYFGFPNMMTISGLQMFLAGYFTSLGGLDNIILCGRMTLIDFPIIHKSMNSEKAFLF